MFFSRNSSKINLLIFIVALYHFSIVKSEEVRQQKVVVKVQAAASNPPGKNFGCPGPNNNGDKDGNLAISDEKYLHSWENGKRPPLSTLKMVCKDLSDLKTGDFVFITVQGKEEVYELAGTDFGKEGSVYKVERNGDTFAFKHPSTTGFLFFNSLSYYVGVKKDSDVLDMFQTFDSNETSFKLCYHQKLNGFVMKNSSNDKCLTVCEKLFGHSPCFRKDQCAAIRIYKIQAYCLQRQKPIESKSNNKSTKKEQLEKIKEKEALVNTAKASGRGQSTATAAQTPLTSVALDSYQKISGKFIPVREVRVNKIIIVHRRLPREKQPIVNAVVSSPEVIKSCTASFSPAQSYNTTGLPAPCPICQSKPCTCTLMQTTPIPIYNTSTSTVKVFVTSKPITKIVTSTMKVTVASSRIITQTIPTTISRVLTLTSKVQTTSTEKVSVTATKTIPLTLTSQALCETVTTSLTCTTTEKPIGTSSCTVGVETLTGTVRPVTETMIATSSAGTSFYPTLTCYTTETIDTYV